MINAYSHASRSGSFRGLSAALLFFATTASAQALEGKALLDKFVADLAQKGTKVSWSNLSEQSSASFTLQGVTVENAKGRQVNIATVTIQDLKELGGNRVALGSLAIANVSGETKDNGTARIDSIAATDANVPVGIWEDGLTDEERKERLQFGNLSISGVAIENAKGGMTMKALTLTDADVPLDWRFNPKTEYSGEPAQPLKFDAFAVSEFTATGNGMTVNVDSVVAKEGNFPTSAYSGMSGFLRVASSASVNGVSVSAGGPPVFSFDTMGMTMPPQEADGTYRSNTVIDGLFINLAAIPDPKTQAVFQQLGYETISGSLTGNGSYNPNDGLAAVDDMKLALKDMFDLSLSYKITGYTPEMGEKLAKAQLAMEKGTPAPQAFGAILPDLAGIKLDSLNLALTDQSLTGKLLDFQAQQMGTTGDQLAQAAPMMIGLGMGGLGMPQFTEMVTEAVGKFLKDKGTLSVTAQPAQPVSIVEVVMKGQADPSSVPNLIGLKVASQ